VLTSVSTNVHIDEKRGMWADLRELLAESTIPSEGCPCGIYPESGSSAGATADVLLPAWYIVVEMYTSLSEDGILARSSLHIATAMLVVARSGGTEITTPEVNRGASPAPR
jgi:hypothetical protein